MPLLARLSLAALVILGISACDKAPDRFAAAEPGEAFSGGATSVRQYDQNAFSQPSANLSPMRRLDFSVGNSFFRNPWVIAPASTTARDGLGPLLNTNACQSCHIKDGRGHAPDDTATSAVSMLVRLSIPAGPEHSEVVRQRGIAPEPTYGGQLQDMAIPGIAPEARVRLRYETRRVRFADGHEVELRSPILQLSELGYGPLHPDTLFSLRTAPQMIGLGLLEAIPEQALLANADPEDRDGDGISGRPNRVYDQVRGDTVIGRFGWKAGQPTLNQQNADAFFNDMGLSTSLFSGSSCTDAQSACADMPHGGEPEVSDSILAQVLFYTRNLGVPMRRDVDHPEVLAGKRLFHRAGCQNCHTPQFTTASSGVEPELAGQVIRPYTDLLLHDMGDGLADGRPEFEATGSEWRTPPLWGVGLTQAVSGHTRFLHDGRARNLMEAILWHGGEAETARQTVLTFDQTERAALLRFLESL